MRRGKPPPRAVTLVGRFFWTVGGLGLVPVIPGTMGTLAGVGLVYLATRYPGSETVILAAQGRTVVLGDLIILGLACFFTIVGVPLANLAERVHGKDPQSFVWDEVAGYLVATLALPIFREPVLCVVGGFFAFRFFDILKPWPIRSIEQRPGGIAVMADDILAGIYANATLHAVLLFR